MDKEDYTDDQISNTFDLRAQPVDNMGAAMMDENVIHLADVIRQREPKYDINADLAAVSESLRVDYDALRELLRPMSMTERGIIGTAMFDALTAPVRSLDQIALLLVIAKPRKTEDQSNEA